MSDTKRTILIVDDEVDLCKIISWDFEDSNFNVLIAHSGQDAFKIFEENHIDVLLSDIKMPHGDGVELVRNICASEKKIKYIFLMTGYADYSEESLKEIGIKKLFQKPIDTDVILEYIEGLFKAEE